VVKSKQETNSSSGNARRQADGKPYDDQSNCADDDRPTDRRCGYPQYRGVPDLVVEVLSLRTRNLGRVTKMWEYAQAGIQEYWIVDPQEKVIEVYTLEDDRYLLLGRFGQGDAARSKLLSGFEVRVDEVLQEGSGRG